MLNLCYRYFFLFFILCSTKAYSDIFTDYVSACKTALGFASLPSVHCMSDGKLFFPRSQDPNGAINDFVGNKKINDYVDMTFACRWVNTDVNGLDFAFSIELMVHNRQKGDTCFFQAKNDPSANGFVRAAIKSPTASNASDYWEDPSFVNNSSLRCVNCHTAGPYIASAKISSHLSRLGLLNNGHDTFGKRYKAVTLGNLFTEWNRVIAEHNTQDPCASACHTIGNFPTTDVVEFPSTLLRSLTSTIIPEIISLNLMAPIISGDNYNWVNMDHPAADNPLGEGDYETLTGLEQLYPKFYCDSPQSISARVVGSEDIFYPSPFPDKLYKFNLRDGLVCKNADQPDGRQCRNYEVNYLCDSEWNDDDWFSRDRPTASGDYESRSSHPNLCASPTAIMARYNAGTQRAPLWITALGPNDRLASFDNTGLVCKNADQGTGKSCSNYVVRFSCASPTNLPTPTPLAKNVNSGNIGIAKKTYVVTTTIAGWQASNTSGREIYVNGVPVTPGQWPLPPQTTDGKYYFSFTQGGVAYASWSFW